MDDEQPDGHIVTKELVREIATQVIRKQMLGIMGGAADVIGTCRDHPAFMTFPVDDRNNLISAVFDATQTAHITITWDDTPIRRITYPEIDYPQEIRDQHQSLLPALNQKFADCDWPDGLRFDRQPIDLGD